MTQIEISINPLAEFLEASESRKNRIIAEQLNPDPVRIPYYQQARASIVKALLDNGNPEHIEIGKNKIAEKVPTKDWQRYNKVNSTEALNRWSDMVLPPALLEHKLVRVQTKAKFFPLYGVNIKVSPTAIFRLEYEGVKYIGAIKVHISKGKPFNNKQSALVAQLLNQFLSNFVAEEDEVVHERLCLCIDPFAGTVINASNKIKYDMKQLKVACQEICTIWDNEAGGQNLGVA